VTRRADLERVLDHVVAQHRALYPEVKHGALFLDKRESSLLTTYWSGSIDVFGGPSSRHGSLNFLSQVALCLPS